MTSYGMTSDDKAKFEEAAATQGDDALKAAKALTEFGVVLRDFAGNVVDTGEEFK
jgi:hypothetical protein